MIKSVVYSCHSENARHCFVCDCACRAPRTYESTQNAEPNDQNDRSSWEEEHEICPNEQILLQDHRIGNYDPNENSQQTRSENQNCSLVEEKHAYAILRKTHGS